MQFWKMLNRASTAALAVTVLAAAAAVVLDEASGAEFSGAVASAWVAVGLLSAVALGALTLFGERLLDDVSRLRRYHAGLVVANIVWVAGLTSVTGGFERQYWALAIAPLLVSAVSMTRTRSLLVGVFFMVAIGVAVVSSGPVVRSDIGSFVVVLPLGPGVTWFVGLLCQSAWRERLVAQEQRDDLALRVNELSEVLAQAAQGDLAVRVETRCRARSSPRSPRPSTTP